MRISDWSSDVCSSDLEHRTSRHSTDGIGRGSHARPSETECQRSRRSPPSHVHRRKIRRKILLKGQAEVERIGLSRENEPDLRPRVSRNMLNTILVSRRDERSEEHTSELQSLMRITCAVLCLKKKNVQ